MLWSSPGWLLRGLEHKAVTCSIPLCHLYCRSRAAKGPPQKDLLGDSTQLGSQSSEFPGGVTLACPTASSVLTFLVRNLELTKVKAACGVVFRVQNSSLKHPVQTLA